MNPWLRWPGIGFCRGNRSLLYPTYPHYLCQRRNCAWSLHAHSYVHIDSVTAFGDIFQGTCAANDIFAQDNTHSKYERVVSDEFYPEVSFLHYIQRRIDAEMNAILEVFRTSIEVNNFEFIIINDATGEDEKAITEFLSKLRTHFNVNIKYYQNEKPVGITTSVTNALKQSHSRYVVLPGFDSTVLPGWLYSLIWTIETLDDAGIIGSMSLTRSGVIESVGGRIFRFGSHSALFEHGKKTLETTLLNLRPVDYLSSPSALLFRREQYVQLSSTFSPTLSPDAFLADIALGFLEHSGQKTYVQPFSITLREQLSRPLRFSDIDAISSLKEKYKAILTNYCPYICEANPNVNDASYSYFLHGSVRPHVLVWDNLMPELDRDSGSLRLFQILKILRLRLGYSVTLETLKLRDIRYVLPLLNMGINVMAPGSFKAIADEISINRNDNNSAVHEKIRRTGLLCPWDVIILCRLRVALATYRFVRKLCPRVPIIYDTVDLAYLRESRTLELRAQSESRNITESEAERLSKIRNNELRLIKFSKATFVVSSFELNILAEYFRGQKNIRILSNIYSTPALAVPVTESMFSKRSGLLFVGNMCHPPNIDAVKLLYTEIIGAIVSAMEELTLNSNLVMHIVCSNLRTCPNEDIIPLLEAHPRFRIYRDISDEDLFKLHQAVRLFVSPLRAGAGVKGKINYALWSGLPIVGTAISTEGMHLEDGKSFLLAENSNDFAHSVSTLYDNYDLWVRLRAGGYRVNENYFSEKAALHMLYTTLKNVSETFSSNISGQKSHPICQILTGRSERLVGRQKCLPSDHPLVVSGKTFFRPQYLHTSLS